MWTELAPWLAQGGVTAVILWAAITLVRIAVAAERRRADDWREAAQTGAEANAVMNANVQKLIASVEQLAASQRETNQTLDKVVTVLTDPTADPPFRRAI